MRPDEVAPRLLPWFDEHGRSLPWRGCADPYRIWVSEVMLQQTRVDVVIPYYHRFLARFPDLHALAGADEEEVLAAWSGLGFYRRARNLYDGAQQVVAEHGGEVPRSPAALGAIKGIGRYTSGAILSAAWDDPVPILDGNVIRVLSRLFRVDGAPDRAATLRELWGLAEAVLPADRPGDFNQALMDLGATVCKPTRPACAACPLARHCEAHAAGDAEDYPRPKRAQKVTFERRVALRIDGPDGRFLLERRPADGLLGGLWELPARTVPQGATTERVLRALEHDLRHVAACVADPVEVGRVDHRFSHRRWTVQVFRAACRGLTRGAADGPERRWVGAEELPELGLPTVSRKALDVSACNPVLR